MVSMVAQLSPVIPTNMLLWNKSILQKPIIKQFNGFATDSVFVVHWKQNK